MQRSHSTKTRPAALARLTRASEERYPIVSVICKFCQFDSSGTNVTNGMDGAAARTEFLDHAPQERVCNGPPHDDSVRTRFHAWPVLARPPAAPAESARPPTTPAEFAGPPSTAISVARTSEAAAFRGS